MKILLIGKNGQIGWELQRTVASLGQVIALGRQELDLTDEQSIRSKVRLIKPDLIINAAAYNAVDKAEQEADLAMAVNGEAPGILAEEAAMLKCPFIHYSTDYVFDGSKNIPYTEVDTPNPLNIYGKTKLAGEEAIRRSDWQYLILRTSWIYGLRGSNFLLTILRLAQEREMLHMVNDQHGAPTWSRMVAEATAQIISVDRKLKESQGIYNLTAAGQTTWFDFAKAILEYPGIISKINVPIIRGIKTADYPTAAARPAYSVLDNNLIHKSYAITLPHWQTQLDLVLQEKYII